jgi:ligand-binding sensor domain-containing protein/signal transduction histidine kinase
MKLHLVERANAVPRLYTLAAAFLLSLFSPVSPAVAQYHVDSWTTDNGLPQNVVRDACQTPDGYLWLATMDGLVRFDGVRFTVFNRSNTPGIDGNRYSSLYCTPGGEIWAGSEMSGVTRYRGGTFSTYNTQQGLPSDAVPAVTGDDTGRIWALSQGSIVQWNEAASRFMDLPPERSRYNYAPNGRFGFWSLDRNNVHLFVRGQVLDYPLPRDWPRHILTRVGQDLNGFIWLASADGRFAKFSGGRWSKTLRREAKQTGSNAFISTYRDAQGNLWTFGIASDAGAYLVEYLSLPSRGQPRRIVFNSFFEDREGSIWLPTDGQGLYRVRKQAISMLSNDDGLPDRNIYPIYQDRSDAIWIGTWNGGLVRFSHGKFTTFSTANGLISNRIQSIGEDHDGVLWVATSPGLQRMRNGSWEGVQNELFPSGEDVRAIHQDPEGSLWFGTSEGVLCYKNRSWTAITAKNGLATNDVRVIIDGREGNLWIGGYGGLTSIYRGQFKRWTEADGLPSNSIRALYEDRDGVLWIGTYDGGLGRLQDGRFTRYTVHDGLFNNGVFQILEDSRGFLWMTSNRGVYRVLKTELNDFAIGGRRAISSIAYGNSDGMKNAECNGGFSPAGVRARDGKIWLPTQDGVAVIDPERVEVNLRPPPVAIESISVDREPVAVDQPLRIQPGQENLEIGYTALSLVNSEQIRFKYQLVGWDRAWVDASTRRMAYYSHVPAGTYVFRVIAANRDGVWNTEGKSVRVVVLPPFYRTWWFLTLVLASAAGALILAWQYRVSQFKRARAVQQAFTRQLLSSQESERKRIAGELHDCLGQRLVVIKNLALLSLDNGSLNNGIPAASAARRHIEEISTEASHALGEVREISYNLRPYQLDRIGLTKATEALVNKASRASTVTFTAEIDDINDVFPKDSEIAFYRVVQECINNVLKHSQATEASVAVRRGVAEVRLTVRDNGKGFTPGAAGSNPASGGFGLIGILERAQLLGGNPVVHSAPSRGTTISIEIPVPENSHEK